MEEGETEEGAGQEEHAEEEEAEVESGSGTPARLSGQYAHDYDQIVNYYDSKRVGKPSLLDATPLFCPSANHTSMLCLQNTKIR